MSGWGDTPRRRAAHGLRAGAMVIGMLAFGGVVRGRPPASQRIVWPERRTRGLDDLARRVPATLRLTVGGKGDVAEVGVRRCEPAGLGLVLDLGFPAGGAKSHRETTHLLFVSFPASASDRAGTRGESGAVPQVLSPADVRLGVRWTLYEPRGRARGLVVHLGGNRYVRRALLKAGWVVLSSDGTGRYFARRKKPQVFSLASGDEVPEVARRIAGVIDDELADWPYSLEAVLAYLGRHRPDVPQAPAAIMGFSIGALGLPAVVARMPERFGAAVIVAGGADLLRISVTSHKHNPGIVLRHRGRPLDQSLWTALDRAYLRHAALDPYTAAAALHDMPVLVVSGHFDQVVPAATGALLWTRLGKPERLAYPVGHRQLLRTIMRFQTQRLVDWTQAALGR